MINDSANVNVSYTIHDNGVIKVDYRLDVKPGLPNIPKIGMQMGIDKNYDTHRIFGRGPLKIILTKVMDLMQGVYNLAVLMILWNHM